MKTSDPYQPISCAMHSELELAIMHGKTLMVYYTKANAPMIEIKPSDVITRGHDEKGEFLVGSDSSGKPVEIRLDKINRFISK